VISTAERHKKLEMLISPWFDDGDETKPTKKRQHFE